MKEVKELIIEFALIQEHWGTKIPKIETSEEVYNLVRNIIISKETDKIIICRYVVLLVACLEQNDRKIDSLNLDRIKNIPKIQVNSSLEDMYILLLAIETYCSMFAK